MLYFENECYVLNKQKVIYKLTVNNNENLGMTTECKLYVHVHIYVPDN